MQAAVDALARGFVLPDAEIVATAAVSRWRGLRVANLNLLVAHDCGGELLDTPRLYPLPRTRTWCRGLLNLRGHLIAAFDLHDYLNLGPWRARRQWWLVLGSDADRVALAIDALPDSLTSTAKAELQLSALPQALRPFIPQAHRVGEDIWLEFRHREFFATAALEVAA